MTTPNPTPTQQGETLTDSRDVDRWKTDLLAAGWIAESAIKWRAPDGSLWRGPYGAWKELQRRTQEQKPALSPCPFCGSTSLSEPYAQEGREAHVSCNACGAVGPSNTLPYGRVKDKHFELGRTLWNTRAAIAGPRHYFCSCGAACNAEEYIVHYFELRHDQPPAPNAVNGATRVAGEQAYSEGFDDAARVSRVLNNVTAADSARRAAEEIASVTASNVRPTANTIEKIISKHFAAAPTNNDAESGEVRFCWVCRSSHRLIASECRAMDGIA